MGADAVLKNRGHRMVISLVSVAAFFAALAGAAGLIGARLPFPRTGNLWHKYEHVRAHGEDVSLLFLGSSRVLHEFIPAEFDAALAARGTAVKSFNFGQDGMWPPESFYLLRQVLALHPPRLRWVFIDLMWVKPTPGDSSATARAVAWHDWHHTVLAWRHLIEAPAPGEHTWGEKMERGWLHARLWMERGFSLGRGHEMMERTLGLRREKPPRKIENEGFEAGREGPLKGSDLEDFQRAMPGMRTGRAEYEMPAAFREELAHVIAEVRAAGAEPVFVRASRIYASERLAEWPFPGVKLLAFDDPEKYPELYDPARRYDPDHLDPEGARIFTRLLAARFAESLHAQ